MSLSDNTQYCCTKTEGHEPIDKGEPFCDKTVLIGIKRGSGVVIDKNDKLYDAVHNNFGGIFSGIEVKAVKSISVIKNSNCGASETVGIHLANPGRQNVINAINILRRNPLIAYAGPNGIVCFDC